MNDYNNMMVMMAVVVTAMMMVRFRVGTCGTKQDKSEQQHLFHIPIPSSVIFVSTAKMV
jgi:hypothetical protein